MSLIISLDGGGALGIGPAYFLALAEAEQGAIHETALAGTSVGGLLALLRAAGHSWQDISHIADVEVPHIFSKKQFDVVGPKWNAGPLEEVCARYLDIPCADARLPFYVPASDLSIGDPVIFTRDHPGRLADVALATSAAPTYFKPRGSLVDGGLTANNPAAIGAIWAHADGVVDLATCRVLSLATGGTFWDDPHVHEEMFVASWLHPVIKYCLSGGQARDTAMCEKLLGNRFMRIAPVDKKDYEMDDLSILPEWRGLWLDAFKANREALASFLG